MSNFIKYTSSDEDIVSVNPTTGKLTFTNTKFGKATITATLPKTDTYQTSFDSYDVENKDNHIATSLSFNGTDITLTEGKTDTGADFTGYTATVADGVAGTITYAASGDNVATVDPTTGTVTIDAAVYGTTTITATFTPADPTQYSGSTATYKITNQQKIDESTIVFDCSTYNSSLIGSRYTDNNNTPRQLKSTAGKDYTFTLTQSIFMDKSIQMKASSGKIVSPTFSSFPSGYKVVVTYEENAPRLYSAELTDAKAEVNTSLKTVSIELPSPTATFTIQSGASYTKIKKIELSALISDSRKDAALAVKEDLVKVKLGEGIYDLSKNITCDNGLNSETFKYTSSDNSYTIVDNLIEFKKVGTTTITAKFDGNDSYKPAEVTYTLEVEDSRPTDADFKFAAENYSEDLAKATDGIVTFNAANVLQNPNNLKVTYTIIAVR